jgi:hypothetical protein
MNKNIKSLEGVEFGFLGTYYGTQFAEEIEISKALLIKEGLKI